MTSKQLAVAVVALVLSGCDMLEHVGLQHDVLTSPYTQRQVWAVTVLLNESGSLEADGVAMADHLVHQLETAPNIDVLPLNRTIEQMALLELDRIASASDAMALMRALGADGLVIGSVTAYDPYDPPQIGMLIELYTLDDAEAIQALDPRVMARVATGDQLELPQAEGQQPVGVVSGVYSADDMRVRHRMERYARHRGQIKDSDAWHMIRSNIDRYAEFIAYVMSQRLMESEAARLAREAKGPPEAS